MQVDLCLLSLHNLTGTLLLTQTIKLPAFSCCVTAQPSRIARLPAEAFDWVAEEFDAGNLGYLLYILSAPVVGTLRLSNSHI